MFKKILVIALVMCFSLMAVYAGDVTLQQIDISAKMDCGGCKSKIERTLKKTDGIKRVLVNMKEQNVKVEYNKNVISDEKIVQIINDLDIEASLKNEAKSSKDKKDASNTTKTR